MTEVIELRQYTLHPGQREVLIELFDREFIETQEATGMRVLGQFRDLGRPDHFVWLRSFPDMRARLQALESFYTGPTWKAHAAAANATMIDTDDVLLLRPVRRGMPSGLDPAVRDTPASSVVTATIHYLPEPPDEELVRFFDGTVLPLLEKAGATPLALLQTEYAENDFTGLPVRTGEHVLVVLTSFPGREAYAEHSGRLAGLPEWRDGVQPHLPDSVERLLLTPTDRSMLR
ncbi:NIPSNAP family protein [Amycolatopsis sp. NPDC051071]|uniref:NIPSNAP family protein n=1 Tax=Amycolatopsis sp. NPDC051071 TaxID=3154637 RepID=UPI0034261E3F